MMRSAIAILALAFMASPIGTGGAAQGATATAARGIACTMEYAPVCGTVAKKRRTFGNACMARAAGATNLKKRVCPGT